MSPEITHTQCSVCVSMRQFNSPYTGETNTKWIFSRTVPFFFVINNRLFWGIVSTVTPFQGNIHVEFVYTDLIISSQNRILTLTLQTFIRQIHLLTLPLLENIASLSIILKKNRWSRSNYNLFISHPRHHNASDVDQVEIDWKYTNP